MGDESSRSDGELMIRKGREQDIYWRWDGRFLAGGGELAGILGDGEYGELIVILAGAD